MAFEGLLTLTHSLRLLIKATLQRLDLLFKFVDYEFHAGEIRQLNRQLILPLRDFLDLQVQLSHSL